MLLKALAERKVPIVKNVRVTDIIRDTPVAGNVRGVRCETKDGIKFIRARQAVVLAAGGFSANQYLRELHDPRVAGLGTDNLPNKTAGDIMMAAVRVGGYLVGMDFIQSTPGAPAGKKMKIILNTRVAESIYVDKRGNRIVDEGSRRDVIRDAVLGTPERYAYTVVDNDTYQAYNSAVHKSVEEGIKINEAWTAPTLKELAVKMGVDPEGLEKGVARYNEFVEKRKGRRLRQSAAQFDEENRTRTFLGVLHGHDCSPYHGRPLVQREGAGSRLAGQCRAASLCSR